MLSNINPPAWRLPDCSALDGRIEGLKETSLWLLFALWFKIWTSAGDSGSAKTGPQRGGYFLGNKLSKKRRKSQILVAVNSCLKSDCDFHLSNVDWNLCKYTEVQIFPVPQRQQNANTQIFLQKAPHRPAACHCSLMRGRLRSQGRACTLHDCHAALSPEVSWRPRPFPVAHRLCFDPTWTTPSQLKVNYCRGHFHPSCCPQVANPAWVLFLDQLLRCYWSQSPSVN